MRTKEQTYPDFSAELEALRDGGFTVELLQKIIEKHQANAGYNRKLYERYQALDSCVPIFERIPRFEGDEEPINNKINNDFFGEIVDFKTGYFAGKAIGYSYSRGDEIEDATGSKAATQEASKALTDFVVRNNMYDKDTELTKNAAIYGYSGRLFYIDPDGNERCLVVPGYETIVLSGTDITEPEYGVRYYSTTDMDGNERWKVEFYDEKTVRYFSGELSNLSESEPEQAHMFDSCPLQGIPNNKELIGDAEKVVSLIDAYDRTVSDNSNDIESFSSAYMVFENVMLDENEMQKAQHSGAIQFNSTNGGKVYYLTKDVNDTFTENHLKRLENNIYRFSKTPNLSDEKFGEASGISLKFKLTGLETKCGMFQAKMVSAGNYMFKLLASSWAKKRIAVDPLQCYMDFQRNFPLDIISEAQAVQAMIASGLPKEIAYDQYSFVDDLDYVMQLIDDEKNGIPSLLDDDVEADGNQATDSDLNKASSTILNGAQITALTGIIQQVQAGVLSREAAINITTSALGVPRESAEMMIEEKSS
ncbi:MAG: phage portal protein [Oscillospiraceae bacterium]